MKLLFISPGTNNVLGFLICEILNRLAPVCRLDLAVIICYNNSMEKGIIVHTIIYNKNKEILVLQRCKNNDTLPLYWDIPGGTLEDGEKPEIGAIREVKEETAIDIINPKLFFVYSNIDKSKNKQFLTLIFYSEYKGGEIKLNNLEHAQYKWVKIDKIKNLKIVCYMQDCLDEVKLRRII